MAGYAIGHSVDSSRDESGRISHGEIADLKKGKRISIWTANEGLLHGRFAGTVQLTPEEYSGHYSSFLESLSNSHLLPELETQVALNLDTGKVLSGTFLGFDLETGGVSSLTADDSTIFLSGRIVIVTKGEGGTSLVELREIDSVRDEKNLYNGDSLRILAATKPLPLYTGLKIITNDFGEHRISMNDVLQMKIQRQGSTRWLMMGLGLVLDVGMLAMYLFLQHTTIK